jgi:P-type Cu2+ transporter
LQVHLADESGWLASFVFAEELRDGAALTVRSLQQAGIEVHLLSGDVPDAAARIAGLVGIKEVEGACSPQDKLDRLKALQAADRHVAMVGDGLNDGPVLAGAHVSFAFGKSVPIAQAQSDFVVMGENLRCIAQTTLLARRTVAIVRQNLWWALAYNLICVPLAIAGWLPAWLAGLGMAASSLLVVLNALRLAGSIPALADLQLRESR